MRRLSLLPIVLLVLCTFAAVAVIAVRGDVFSRFSRWNEFDLLVVSTEHDIDEVHHALSEHGLQPLDITNATIRIEDFNGQETIRIQQLDHRFDEADPRIDPFVRRVSDLFFSRHARGTYHIVYLPQRDSVERRYNEIESALGSTPFFLDDRRPRMTVLAGIAVVLVLAGAVIFSRHRVAPSLLVVIVAGVYIVFHGMPVVSRSALTALAAVYLIRHSQAAEREWFLHGDIDGIRPGFQRALFFAAVVVLFSVMSVFVDTGTENLQSLISYIVYVVALAGVYAGTVAVSGVLYRSAEHPLFTPRPILGHVWQKRQRLADVFPGLGFSLLCLVGLIGAFHFYGDRLSGPEDIFIPVPDHQIIEPTEISSSGEAERLLEALSRSEAETTPLSTSGFFAHRRYQTSLLYNGEYVPPPPGELVLLTRFRRVEDRIETWEEEVMRFDGDWVLDELDVTNESVYSLFVREGGVFSLTWKRLYDLPLPRTSMLVQVLLIFIVTAPLIVPFGLPYRFGIGTVAVASRSARR